MCYLLAVDWSFCSGERTYVDLNTDTQRDIHMMRFSTLELLAPFLQRLPFRAFISYWQSLVYLPFISAPLWHMVDARSFWINDWIYLIVSSFLRHRVDLLASEKIQSSSHTYADVKELSKGLWPRGKLFSRNNISPLSSMPKSMPNEHKLIQRRSRYQSSYQS